MDIYNTIFYQPIFNLLVFLYSLFGNLGIAIILLALVVKTITLPLTNQQKKMAVAQKDTAEKLKELRVKYKDDPQTLLKEQMKLQKGGLSSLGGCLMVIIFIVIFFGVRSSILDLTNQGWHAYNKIAYFKSNKVEQKIELAKNENLDGKNTLDIELKINTDTYKQEIAYWTYTNDEEKKKVASNKDDQLSKNTGTFGQLKGSGGVIKLTNEAKNKNISLYISELHDDYLVNKSTKLDTIYYRTSEPVNNIEGSIKFNSKNIDNIKITKGDFVKLDFFWIDLSKTAVEVANNDLIKNITNSLVLPYLALAILMGLTQIGSSKFLMPTKTEEQSDAMVKLENEIIAEEVEVVKTKNPKKKEKLEKEIKEETTNELSLTEEMAKNMQEMNGTMMWMLGALSILTSLGVLGGATFFPSGISLYWAIQNTYDIVYNLFIKKLLIKYNIIAKT